MQLTTIDASSAKIFTISVLISVGCLVLVILLVLRISIRLSQPITKTVYQSNKIVANSATPL